MHVNIHRIGYQLKYLTLLVTAFAGTSIAAQPEQMYISDILVVNVRDRMQSPSTIVDRVMSDSPVTVIERNGKFLHIVTAAGKQGWIGSQYVKPEPPKSFIIQQLKEEISELRRINFTLQQSSSRNSQNEDLSREETETATTTTEHDELDNINSDGSTPAKQTPNTKTPLTLSEDYNALQQQYTLLLMDKEILEQQLAISQKSPTQSTEQVKATPQQSQIIALIRGDFFNSNTIYSIYWFCAGAFVFLLGILSGKLSGRRKNRFRI
jgi:SH3 domain protein